jgi:outer membrane lipoprotein-sorting protein
MNEMIVSAVSGKVFDNPDYQINITENDESYKLELLSNSEVIVQMIKQLELYFNKETYAITKLKIIEPNSDYSLIHFTNQILNESIAENIFLP